MPLILQYDFMVRALIAGVLVGGLAPVLGTFLVLRRVSLIADTLAHVALFGIAIGLTVNLWPTFTTFVAVTIAAVLIERLRSTGKLPGDVALAVVLYSTLAGAVVLFSVVGGFNVDLHGFLFGSVLSVASIDLLYLAILALVVIVGVTAFFIELAQATFDDELARVSGISVEWVSLGLALLTATTITLGMRLFGVLLIGALLVVPVLAGQALANTLRGAIVVASLVGVLSALAGLTTAFYADVAAGGSVILSAIVLLLLALAWRHARPRRGS